MPVLSAVPGQSVVSFLRTPDSRSWPAGWHPSPCIITWPAAGYQTLYHSLTQQGTGTWEGLTFQKQFARAFTVDCTPVHCVVTVEHSAVVQVILVIPPDVQMIQETPTLSYVLLLTLQVKPAYLFISTWNELLAQAQSNLNAYGSSASAPGLSMGLESDDTAFNRSFVGAGTAVMRHMLACPAAAA
jgi:hypothetical protein